MVVLEVSPGVVCTISAAQREVSEVCFGGVVAQVRHPQRAEPAREHTEGRMTGPSGISIESFRQTQMNDQMDALIEAIRDVVEELKLLRSLVQVGFRVTTS